MNHENHNEAGEIQTCVTRCERDAHDGKYCDVITIVTLDNFDVKTIKMVQNNVVETFKRWRIFGQTAAILAEPIFLHDAYHPKS